MCALGAGLIGAAPQPVSLAGSGWIIVAIDGAALETAPVDGVDHRPHLRFAQRSYSGHAGCNALGGLFVQRSTRVYTYPGPQTAMGCGGRRAAQEAALDAVMRAAPTITRAGEQLTLSAVGRRIDLHREPTLTAIGDPPSAWQGASLAGQRFEMHSVDGASLSRRPAPLLTFTRTGVTIANVCARPVTGHYIQRPATLRVEWRNGACLGARTPAGALGMVSGPNGELLLAGDGHWWAGDNLRRDRPK